MQHISIYAFADEASPIIDNQIRAMQRNRLNGLEIRNVDNVNIADISVEKAREVREKMDNAGLVTWSIGSPIGKIDMEKDDFASHLEKTKHVLEIAHILNCQNIRMFSFYIPVGKNPADYQNEVMDRLGKLAELAEKEEITLCHENEKGIFGDVPERCLQIFNAVPGIKGIFDPANYVQCDVNTLDAWKLLKPYIKYMHIKDAVADTKIIVPAGEGDGHIPEIAKDFILSGGGDFTMEPHLVEFNGLQGLEREGEQSHIGKYADLSGDETFDIACKAFQNIISF